jgi:aspartate aminotransferase-like enzyme
MLSESDKENAAQLYIMTHFETSIGVKSPDFRVCDIFSYQENKMNVMCEY